MLKCIIFDIGGVIIDFYNEDDYYPYLSRISGVQLHRVIKLVDYDIRVDLDKGTTTQAAFEKEMVRQFGIRIWSGSKWSGVTCESGFKSPQPQAFSSGIPHPSSQPFSSACSCSV